MTPGRVVLGMLAVEGFLILSERFQWFAFNQHKGYTMLIAVAAVAAIMLLTSFWFLLSLIFKWRFQFSIRSLLVLMVVVAVACSWLAAARKRAEGQKVAIVKLAGTVAYDYQFDALDKFNPGATPPGPAWLRELLGDDFFTTAISLNLDYTHVTDTDLEYLKGLPELRDLGLSGFYITDAGLEHLKGLTQLQSLRLASTPVTGIGLEHLKGLGGLKRLDLSRSRVTDPGLEHLKGLTQLQWLWLSGTKVSDAGVTGLRKALPNADVERR